MTLNELTGVFESRCGVPLEEPDKTEEQGGGKGVGTVKPTLVGCTRDLQKKQLVEAESGDDDDDGDKHAEEEVFEEERSKTRRQKARTQTCRAIS